MRRHIDPDGRPWDVIIGRESFGALYALFIPAAGNTGAVRQSLLRADSQADAEAELAGMEESDMNDLLERSELKEMQ